MGKMGKMFREKRMLWKKWTQKCSHHIKSLSFNYVWIGEMKLSEFILLNVSEKAKESTDVGRVMKGHAE